MDSTWTFWQPLLGIASAAFLLGWLACAMPARRRIGRLEASLRRFQQTASEGKRLLGISETGRLEAEGSVTELEQTIRQLPEIAQRLTATQDIREIPGLALELVHEVFHPRYSVFFRMGRGELIAVAVQGTTEYDIGRRIPSGEGIVGWTALKQFPLTPEDAQQESPLVRAQHLEKGPYEEFQLCLPLIQGDHTVGTLLIGPSPREVAHASEIGRTIALLTAVAINSARLLRHQRILAQCDGLTGLLNKTNILAELEQLLAGTEPIPRFVSTFLFDIDHFKDFNDTHGHLAGDDLLRGLGDLLKDTVREGECVGRYGGEEFLLVLPGASKDQALSVAERIRSGIAKHSFPLGQGQPMGRATISGGVATFPMDSREPAELLKRADEALYQAKRAGRDRVLSYTSSDLTLDDPILVESEEKKP